MNETIEDKKKKEKQKIITRLLLLKAAVVLICGALIADLGYCFMKEFVVFSDLLTLLAGGVTLWGIGVVINGFCRLGEALKYMANPEKDPF